MARVSLDLKHFKHVKSGKDTTTLQHKDGHMLEIAHKSLSPEFQEQLNALCNGGYAKKMADGGEIAPIKKENYKPSKESKEQPKKMAYGGDPQADQPNMSIDPNLKAQLEAAEAQKLQQVAAIDNVRQAVDKNTPEPKAPTTDDKSPGFMDALSGIGKGISDFVTGPHTGDDPLGDVKKFITQPHITGYQAPPEAPQAMAQAEAPQAPAQEPSALMPEQPQAPVEDPMKKAEDIGEEGYKNQLKGAEQKAKAEGDLGREQAQLLSNQIQAQRDAQEAFKQQFQELNTERQAHIADIQNGHIDPNKYWENHSKIASGIGMILAGFNPAGGPNAAVNFLQHQMEQNIKAQQANLDSDQNLLAANLKQFGNLKDATDMTRVMQADMMVNQLAKAAATAKSPLAIAAANTAKGEIQSKYAPVLQKLLMSRTLNTLESQAKNDPRKLEQFIDSVAKVDPKRADQLRQRMVPSLGMANTDEGAKGLREMQTTVKTVKSGIDRLREISKISGKSLSPSLRAEADNIRTQLIGRLRVPITGPGAMSEGERELLMNAIPGVTDMMTLDSSNKVKLDTLEKGILNNYRNMATANGIKLPGSMDQTQDKRSQAEAWLKANPNSPKAAEIRKALGIK